MAKIKLGALAQDVRGSLAGTTFSRNRFGSYARQKVSPVQPRTARQLTQRALFTDASQGWRALTQAERNSWGTYAANNPIVNVFGDSQTMSGINAFTRINSVLATAGLAAVTDPPTPGTPGPLATSVTATGATGVVAVTFTTNPVVDDKYFIFTTRGVSTGVQFVNSDYRLAGVATGVAATLVYNVTPQTFNPRLNFIAGQKVGVLVACVGQDGVYQPRASFLVTAA